MTRKERIKKALIDAGVSNVTDEMVNALDKAFGEELDGNFIPKSKFDEVNEQLKTEKAATKNLTDEITKLKGFEGTVEELKGQISKLEGDAKTAKADNEKKYVEFRKKAAIRLQLTKDNAQDADLILGMMNLDEIEIDDNDKITSGYKEKIASIKKDKPYLFKAVQQEKQGKEKYAFLRGAGKPGDGDAGAGGGEGELDDTQKIIKSVVDQGKKQAEVKEVNSDYFFGGAKPADKK